jgi:hypothetical protein
LTRTVAVSLRHRGTKRHSFGCALATKSLCPANTGASGLPVSASHSARGLREKVQEAARRLRIPKSRRFVQRCRDNATSVWAECSADHGFCVPSRGKRRWPVISRFRHRLSSTPERNYLRTHRPTMPLAPLQLTLPFWKTGGPPTSLQIADTIISLSSQAVMSSFTSNARKLEGPASPRAPLAPGAPEGPGGPISPRMPWGPAGPCDPASPWGPVGPVGPGAPVEPCAPVGP